MDNLFFPNLDFKYIHDTSVLADLFFACTIIITLVVARYSTLAKLIRDTRGDFKTKNKSFFENQSELNHHLTQYQQRLFYLKNTLYFSLFGGVSLCASIIFVCFEHKTSSVIFFVLYIFLIFLALLTLVKELSISFKALNEHLNLMKN
jgi:hypothetical protein